MSALGIILLLIVGSKSIDGTVYDVVEPTEWWQTATVYQVWIRSFKDSDGDGIGDLNGVTSELDHFVDMGVSAIWLTPFYPSPMIDSGYDVTDFFAIDPIYGTLDDFDNLVAKAEELGIRVVIDYVPNHTSDQHVWFTNSKAGIEPYTDYYIWKEGTIDENGTRHPPNNWVSHFGGSVWEWVEEREAYYLHQFSKKQVDLDFTNPLVIEETKKFLTFWSDHGVDGFHFAAVPFLIEDSSFADEPLSGLDVPSTDMSYVTHVFTTDRPENLDIMRTWREHLDSYSEEKGDGVVRAMFSEGYSNVSVVMEYYDYGLQVLLHFYPTHDHVTDATQMESPSTIADLIDLWMGNMPHGATANWQVGNHDDTRMATKFGSESVDGIHFILYLLPGLAINYYGDEIGMTNTFLTWEETQDPQACNDVEANYLSNSRDPMRTPFQWDSTTSAGFSTNSTTVLKVNENYLELNLAAQKEADVSHYKNVQAVIKLRSDPVIQKGSLNVEIIDDQVIAFSRELVDYQPIVMVMNWSNTTDMTVSLEVFENVPDTLEVLIADIYSGIAVGDVWAKTSIELPPKAAVVLRGIDA